MIQFVSNTDDIKTEGMFAVNMTGTYKEKKDLINELKEKFLFPDYFGDNWDALYDCLCDLNWINNSKIILIHKRLPELNDKSTKIYLSILSDVITAWDLDCNKKFEVFFELKDKKKIKELLNKI